MNRSGLKTPLLAVLAGLAAVGVRAECTALSVNITHRKECKGDEIIKIDANAKESLGLDPVAPGTWINLNPTVSGTGSNPTAENTVDWKDSVGNSDRYTDTKLYICGRKYDSNGTTWRCRDTATLNEARLLSGYIDDNQYNNFAGFKVTGIPYGKYRANIYFTIDAGSVCKAYEINGKWYRGDGKTTVAAKSGDSWGVKVTDQNKNNESVKPGINTLSVDGLTGDLLVRTHNGSVSGARGRIAGFQIVEWPEIDFQATCSGEKLKLSEVLWNGGLTPKAGHFNRAELTVPAGAELTLDTPVYDRLNLVCQGSLKLIYAVSVPEAAVNTDRVTGSVYREYNAPQGSVETFPNGQSLYTAGAGSRENPASFVLNVPDGAVILSGKTYWMNDSCSATKSNVSFRGAEVHCPGRLCVGEAIFKIDGSVIEADAFAMSQGGANRHSVVELRTDSTVTVTGSVNGDTNQSSVMFGHWVGTSEFGMIGNNSKFISEKADVLVGKSGGTHRVRLQNGLFKVHGFRLASGSQTTASLELAGGEMCLGEGGLRPYDTSKKLDFTVTRDSVLSAYQRAEIAHAATVADGVTLTLDGTAAPVCLMQDRPFELTGTGRVLVKGTVEAKAGAEAGMTVAEGAVLKLRIPSEYLATGYESKAKTEGTGRIDLVTDGGDSVGENGVLLPGTVCTYAAGAWNPRAPRNNDAVTVTFTETTPELVFDNAEDLCLTLVTLKGSVPGRVVCKGGSVRTLALDIQATAGVTLPASLLPGSAAAPLKCPVSSDITVEVPEGADETVYTQFEGDATLFKSGAGCLTVSDRIACAVNVKQGSLRAPGFPKKLSGEVGTEYVQNGGDRVEHNGNLFKGFKGTYVVDGKTAYRAYKQTIPFPMEVRSGVIQAGGNNNGYEAYTNFNETITVGGGKESAEIKFDGWGASGRFNKGLILRDKGELVLQNSRSGGCRITTDGKNPRPAIVVDAPNGAATIKGCTTGNYAVSMPISGVGTLILGQHAGNNTYRLEYAISDKSETEKLSLDIRYKNAQLLNGGNSYSGGTHIAEGVAPYYVNKDVFGKGPVTVDGQMSINYDTDDYFHALGGSGQIYVNRKVRMSKSALPGRTGQLIVTRDAVLDIATHQVALFDPKNYCSGNDKLKVEGRLVTHNWNYGGALGNLGNNTPHVLLNGGTVVFTESIDSIRGFTVNKNNGSLELPNGGRFFKDAGNQYTQIANEGTLYLKVASPETDARAAYRFDCSVAGTVQVEKGVTLETAGTYTNLKLADGASFGVTGTPLKVTGVLTLPAGTVPLVPAKDMPRVAPVLTLKDAAAAKALDLKKFKVPEGMALSVKDNQIVLTNEAVQPEPDIQGPDGNVIEATPEQKQCILEAAKKAGITAQAELKVTLSVGGKTVAAPTSEAIANALSVFDGIASNDNGTLRVVYNFGVTDMRVDMKAAAPRLLVASAVETQSANGETQPAGFAQGTVISVIAVGAGGAETVVESQELMPDEVNTFFGPQAPNRGVVYRSVGVAQDGKPCFYRVRVTRQQ